MSRVVRVCLDEVPPTQVLMLNLEHGATMPVHRDPGKSCESPQDSMRRVCGQGPRGDMSQG